MNKYFVTSLCKNGLLGGGITISDTGVTYKTNKLTVPDEYRKIEMKYENIEFFTASKFLFLPIVNITLKNRKEYKFLLFSSNFSSLLREMGVKERKIS